MASAQGHIVEHRPNGSRMQRQASRLRWVAVASNVGGPWHLGAGDVPDRDRLRGSKPTQAAHARFAGTYCGGRHRRSESPAAQAVAHIRDRDAAPLEWRTSERAVEPQVDPMSKVLTLGLP